jgi:uncharacterized protein (TIGR02453 family)
MAQVLVCPQAMRAFPGFSPEALTFLRNLKRNNRRDWFQPRKERYEAQIRVPMMDLACCLSREFARFAPEYVTPPDKSVFRIYRDAHFSHDRKPYATHMAAVFARQGAERLRGPCFYFHFTDRELLALGGVYAPERDELPAYRNFLGGHYRELEAILANPDLRATVGGLHGDQMVRVPRGFCPGHPAASLLRRRQWYLASILDTGLLTTPRLLPELARRFELMAPFVNFMNQPFPRKPRLKRTAFTALGGCHEQA